MTFDSYTVCKTQIKSLRNQIRELWSSSVPAAPKLDFRIQRHENGCLLHIRYRSNAGNSKFVGLGIHCHVVLDAESFVIIDPDCGIDPCRLPLGLDNRDLRKECRKSIAEAICGKIFDRYAAGKMK